MFSRDDLFFFELEGLLYAFDEGIDWRRGAPESAPFSGFGEAGRREGGRGKFSGFGSSLSGA